MIAPEPAEIERTVAGIETQAAIDRQFGAARLALGRAGEIRHRAVDDRKIHRGGSKRRRGENGSADGGMPEAGMEKAHV